MILGTAPVLVDLVRANEAMGLRTIVVMAPSQARERGSVSVRNVVFEDLDHSIFRDHVLSSCEPKRTLFASLGARWIFRRQVIESLMHGNLVNFHGTRLPMDAGGGGYSWRILRGDRIETQLVHLVDEGIDTGGVLASERRIFPPSCVRPIDYEAVYFSNLIGFYNRFVAALKRGESFEVKNQPPYLGSYFPRLKTDLHGFIDWRLDAAQLHRFICAFDQPYPGASTFLGDRKVRLRSAHLHGGEVLQHSFASGLVLRHDCNWIVVATAGSEVLLVEEAIDAEGTNILSTIRPGDRFHTPVESLDAARGSRVFYNSRSND